MRASSRLLSFTLATGLVLSIPGHGFAQGFDAATLRCRSAVARSGVKLTRAVLKELISCHKRRVADGSLAGTDCNDAASADLKGRIPVAEGRFADSLTKHCEGVVPASALYETCPAPCASDVPIKTFSDVAECLVCLDRAKLKSFAESAWRTPASPLQGREDADCLRSITSRGARLLNSVLKIVTGCQAMQEKSGATTIDYCTDTAFLELVDSAFNGSVLELGLGDCRRLPLAETQLEPCGDAVTSPDLVFCVLDAARSHGRQVASSYLELAETTTTTTTTSTTTTLPVGAPGCPNEAEIVVYSRNSHAACTTDDDCSAPRTCEAGQCTSETDLDLGWTGYGHNADKNQEISLRAHLYCEGTGGPICGECTVVGSPGDCRCSNASDRSCDSLSASDGDCPACSGGVLNGESCAEDADCSGLCARRCAGSRSRSCVDDSDCPGSVCPLTNTRCKDGTACSTSEQCSGTCTSHSACECYLGAPLPLSAGLPICTVQHLSREISGTVDVDLGASELQIQSRTRVHIGQDQNRPCPVCGGKCSHDSSPCQIDDDCGAGNTCTQDVVGDGIRDGICIGGRRGGQSCDVTGNNASWPARAGATGGGGYSLDCLPLAGTNVSGSGLVTNMISTTGSTSLTAGLPCGAAAPGEFCPCLMCSGGSGTPCSSNDDCASAPAHCSLSTGITCNGNAECEAADLGTCSTSRCSRDFTLVCTSNSDCQDRPVGTCVAPTCSSTSLDYAPKPNGCDQGLCSDVGNGEGECSSGPDDSYCDGVVKADGGGILECSTDFDCSVVAVGVDGGHCSIVQRRRCFLDPIVATGAADPMYPVTAAAYCMPPAGLVNVAFGLPGPARLVSRTALSSRCASDPAVQYTPGIGGCP